MSGGWKGGLWSRFISAPVVVGLVAAAPYTSLLFSGDLVLKESIYSDYGSFQLPMREFAQQEFAAGRFPLWVPWLGCGIPMHATGQVGLCYPLLTPLLWVMSANTAIKLSLFLHAVLCYVGQYRLGRMLSLSPAAAAIAGLIATQSGFMTGHLVMGHVAHVFAMGLLPWFFGSVIAVCRDPTPRSGRRFALVTSGLLLLGNPQVPYYALLFGGWWALGSLARGSASRHRLRAVATLGIGGGLVVLVAAVQLLPTLELVRDNAGLSTRGSAEYAGSYALDGLDLYRFVVPSLKGNPMVGLAEFAPPDFYHEKVCYMGIAAWLLALAGLFRSHAPRWTLAAVVLALLGIVIALGRSTPLFDALGAVVPGLFLFRCPGRCLAIVCLFVALLAGYGFDVQRGPWTPISRSQLMKTTCALFAMAVVAGLLIASATSAMNVTEWTVFAARDLQAEIYASLFVSAASAAAVMRLHRLSSRASVVLMTALILVDLGYFNLRCVQYEARRVEAPPETVRSAADAFRFLEAPSYPRVFKNEVPYSKLVPQAVGYCLRMVGTNEGGVLPAACERLFAALEHNPAGALPCASCRFIAQRTDSIAWASLPAARPRVRWASDDELSELQRPLDVIRPREGDSSVGNPEEADITVRIDEPQRLVVEISAAADGVLVVADTWYPGWEATIDGAPSEILRIHECFRGVRVPKGRHVVEMRYRPRSFRIGMALSGLGVFLVLGGGVSHRSHRKLPWAARFVRAKAPLA